MDVPCVSQAGTNIEWLQQWQILMYTPRHWHLKSKLPAHTTFFDFNTALLLLFPQFQVRLSEMASGLNSCDSWADSFHPMIASVPQTSRDALICFTFTSE